MTIETMPITSLGSAAAAVVERTDARRTMDRFEQLCIPEPNSGCWLWLGNLGSAGYGNFSIGGKAYRANRASYMIYIGPLESRKQFVCHRCDNIACVNPDHLFLGDAFANMRDCKAKGRLAFPLGSARANSKLNESVVRAIVADTRPYREIAADYGVHNSTVLGVKSGRLWARVTGGSDVRLGMRRGDRNHKTKLSAGDVIAIRKDPRSNTVVAKEMGVTRHHIWWLRKHGV